MATEPICATTLAQVAEIYGSTLASVQHWRKAGMPGRPGAWPLRDIAAWLRGPGGPWSPKADALLDDGTDSPGLERYRQARARLAELEVGEREADLIVRADARQSLGRWAAILRAAGERLAKQHGNDAGAILNEALDQCERIVELEFGDKARQPGSRTPPPAR